MINIEILRDYLIATEEFLEKQVQTAYEIKENYLLKHGLTRSEIERNDDLRLWVAMAELEVYEFWSFEYTFPSILQKSFFLMVYSTFEKHLDHVCKSMQQSNNLPLSVTDLQGNGIIRAQKYLEKLGNIDFPDTREWNEILAYNKLRNCFAHNDGMLKGCAHADFISKSVFNEVL